MAVSGATTLPSQPPTSAGSLRAYEQIGQHRQPVAQQDRDSLILFGFFEAPPFLHCVDWTQLSAEGYEPVDGLAAQTDDGAKLRCMTLLLLQRAQPSKRSYVRDLAWDETLLPLLPAAVATAFNEQRKRAVERATARHESLAAFDPRAHAGRKQEDTLEVIEGGGQTMILLHAEALGDLDTDGNEDLVFLESLLARHWPEALQDVDVWRNKTPLALLARYPGPNDMHEHADEVLQNIHRRGHRYLMAPQTQRMLDCAQR